MFARRLVALSRRVFSSQPAGSKLFRAPPLPRSQPFLHSQSLPRSQSILSRALLPSPSARQLPLSRRFFSDLHIRSLFGEPSLTAYDWMSRPRYIDAFGVHIEYSASILAGHAAFVLLGLSFAFHDIIWLRALACSSGALTMFFTYFHPHGRPLWLPFGWNMVFVIINLLHILHYLWEDYKANNLRDEEEELMNLVFDCTGISKVDFLKLVRSGKWEEYPLGHEIIHEGEQNSKIFLISRGQALVTVHGEPLYHLGPGNYSGEMGLHVGMHISTPLTASATVTVTKSKGTTPVPACSAPPPSYNMITESGASFAAPPPKSDQSKTENLPSSSVTKGSGPTDVLRCLVWSRAHLMELLEENPTLQHSIQASITADLVRKLKVNSLAGVNNNSDPHTILEKSLMEYRNLMRYILDKGVVLPRERNILARFRSIHLIDDQQHVNVLSSFQWHPLEYERGVKLGTDELKVALDRQARGLTPFQERSAKIVSKTEHPFALR